MNWNPFRSGFLGFEARGLAVLTLLAGGSLGLFAGRALWAERPTTGVAPVLNPAIEAKVSLYAEAFRLDTPGADRVRRTLQEYDQQVLEVYRSLRVSQANRFKSLSAEFEERMRTILDEYRVPAGR